MNHEQQETFLATMGQYIRDQIKDATEPLTLRIALLEAQNEAQSKMISELQEGGLRYRGTFQRAERYRRGDVCTHDGSMWVALQDIAPGENLVPGKWQLSVKRGRDQYKDFPIKRTA